MPFNFPDPAVSTTATNPVTGATYQWKADPGKWVLTGGAPEATPAVTISLYPPEDPIKGDLWIHEETLVEYAWDGEQWFEVGNSCLENFSESDASKIFYQASEPTIVDNDGEPLVTGMVWIKKSSNIEEHNVEYIYNTDKWELLNTLHRYGSIIDDATDAVTYKWNKDVNIESDEYVTIKGTDFEVDAEYCEITAPKLFYNYTENYTITSKNTGKHLLHLDPDEITTEVLVDDDSEDISLTTKLYVDEKDEKLYQDILELEQEIDAIAPATQRGYWTYTDTGLVDASGTYTMWTNAFDDGLGSQTDAFASVGNIAMNPTDSDGNFNDFSDVEAGQLLEIFEDGDQDFGLYQVEHIQKRVAILGAGGLTYEYWSIDVTTLRSGTGDTASGKARFKFFHPPEGGNASEFVLKSGDTMTGTLEINVPISVPDTSLFEVKGIQGNSGTGDTVLKILRKTDGDQARYYGPVKFGKELTTKEYVDSSTTIYQDTPPVEDPDNPFPSGKLWVDSTDLSGYVWSETAWVELSLDGQNSGGGGNFVSKEGGDSMEGPLEISGDRDPDADGVVSTLKTLNVDSGEPENLELKRNGTTGIYIEDGQNNYMGNIKFGTANAQLFGATGIEIGYFGADALYYKGQINNEKAVTNKGYVDGKFDFSQYPELT